MVTRPPNLEERKAYLQKFIADFPVPPTITLLNGEFGEFDLEAGTLTSYFTPGDKLLNPAGKVQGGMITAMLDDTMGPLMVVMAAGRAFPSSTDLHTRYFRPVLPGKKYRCEAKITRQGRNLCYSQASLYNEKGQEMAQAIQTAVMRSLGD